MKTLMITGGHVLDPAQGIDSLTDITVEEDRFTEIGEPASERAGQGNRETPSGPVAGVERVDATGLMLVPGVVDLHTHLYEGVSHYGVDPDTYCLGRGVTTAVDAGSSGAQTFPGFRRYVIERSSTRVLAFIHVAVQGMITDLVGELEDLRWASPERTVARAREHPDVIVGVKIRLGYQMVGNDPQPALLLARKAADELGLPLMVHIIDMRRPITWLMPYLGLGDIVTHSFHGNEGGILQPDGRLYPEVVAARDRGVIFDIGHGIGSFSYAVARSAFAQDFYPKTISSDIHSHNVGGPAYDQATTLSKLLHVGMPLAEVIRATTSAPAAAVGRGESLGRLAPSREADLTAFEVRTGSWALTDGTGTSETVERLLVPRFVLRGGRLQDLSWPVPELLVGTDSAHSG